MSLYLKYRPTTFDEVYGQDDAVKLLKAVVDMSKEDRPKVFLFGGASGCGKTTLAMVFARAIGINPDFTDFYTMDASKDRSIDNVRNLCNMMGTRPMGRTAEGRIFLLDESHQLQKAAQEALLKKCEDTPPDTYIIFATTEPQALGTALRSRCKCITINALTPQAIYTNLKRVAGAEGIAINDAELKQIAQNSDNSARVSLQILENFALNGGDVNKAISVSSGMCSELQANTHTLCQALIDRRATWAEVVSFCNTYKGQTEPVRQAILGYLRGCLLRSKNHADRGRFIALIECFLEPHYDCSNAAFVYQMAVAFELK